MKKPICMALALAMVLSLAACGGKTNAPAATSAPTAAAEIAAPKDSINVCIASEPDTIDPALNSSVDGATMISHLFAGIARWGRDSEGKAVLEPDCAEELVEGVLNEDGTVTYTYTLRDGLKWSDGRELTAGDFVFAWNRAASEALGADYGFLFNCIKGYPDALAVEAPDARTLVVTLNNPLAYWNELLAFPVFFPVREDVAAVLLNEKNVSLGGFSVRIPVGTLPAGTYRIGLMAADRCSRQQLVRMTDRCVVLR